MRRLLGGTKDRPVLIRSIGVAVPAHNEEERLGACLRGAPRASSTGLTGTHRRGRRRLHRWNGRRSPGPPAPRCSRWPAQCRRCPRHRSRSGSSRPPSCRSRSCGWPRPMLTAGCHLTGWSGKPNGGQTAGTPSPARWSWTTGRPSSPRRLPYSPRSTAPLGTTTRTCTGRTSVFQEGLRSGGRLPRLALAEDHALVAALTKCGLSVARAGGAAGGHFGPARSPGAARLRRRPAHDGRGRRRPLRG